MEFGTYREVDDTFVRLNGEMILSDHAILTIETSRGLGVELDMPELVRLVLWARKKMAEEEETKEE